MNTKNIILKISYLYHVIRYFNTVICIQFYAFTGKPEISIGTTDCTAEGLIQLNCTIPNQTLDNKLWYINDPSNLVMLDCDIRDAYKPHVNLTQCSRNDGIYNIVILTESGFDYTGNWTCFHDSLSDYEEISADTLEYCKFEQYLFIF